MKVRSPDGTTWRVSRRWVPWRRRLKGSLDGMPDLHLSWLGDDPISLIIGVVAFVVLLPFILIALVAGAELLLLLVVFPVALLGRVVFGRQWTVEVRRGWRPYAEDLAGDWQRSGLRIHEIADAIERGEVPEQTLGERTDSQGRR